MSPTSSSVLARASRSSGAANKRSSERLSRLCGGIAEVTLLVLTLALPLFLLPFGSDVLELPKQTLLIAGAAVATLAWVGKMLAERKFEYRRTAMNAIVLLFVGVTVASSLFSIDRYVSLFGGNGQELFGLPTVFALALLYFVTTNVIRTPAQVGRIMTAWAVSGLLAGVYGILQGIGIHVLPFAFADSAGFNTVGTVSTLGIFLASSATMAGAMLMRGHVRSLEKAMFRGANDVLLWATVVVSLFVICVIDFWPVTASLMLGSALLLAFAFFHARASKGMTAVVAPTATFFIAVLLLAFKFPIALGYPTEVMPSPRASTEITFQAVRDRPLLGSGPGTFLEDYARYRSPEVNTTAFWNLRFDRASSHLLTIFATTGILGGVAWLLFLLFLLGSASRRLFTAEEGTWHVLVGAFSSWFVLAMASFSYSSSLTLVFLLWLAASLLVVAHRPDFLTSDFEDSPRASMLTSFIFIFLLVFSLAWLFVQGERFAADLHYEKALTGPTDGTGVAEVSDHLARAVVLVPTSDVYQRNLAVALLAQANQKATGDLGLSKKDGESDAAYQTRVADAQQQRSREVSDLATRAVAVAKKATELAPENVENWVALASVYSSLLGSAQGADALVIEAYGEAQKREPSNPVFATEIGKTHLYVASALRASSGSASGDQKKDVEGKISDNLGRAVDSFNTSIKLKPDYAPAHYNLALTLDAQGKTKDAIKRMEAVAQASSRDVGVGFQLALLYYRDGRKDDAIKTLESVVAIAPTYANARWYLASMYEEAGEKDKAIEQVQKVLELNPGNADVQKKLDELQGKSSGSSGLPQPIDEQGVSQNQPSVSQ